MNIRIRAIFERYQSGKASKAEKKLVEDWFSSFDNDQQEILNDGKKAEFFNHMDEEMLRFFPVHDKKHEFGNRWLQVAALLLIGLGIFLFKGLRMSNNLDEQLVYTTISAPKGIKKQFSLADGTFVYLNAGSSLRIPSNFAVKDRKILLSGEAFFVVTHNQTKPFSIRSGKLLVADIGTAFNVKAYPGDEQIKVAVESGEVKVEQSELNSRPKTLVRSLTHNQQLVYNQKTFRAMLNTVQTSDVSAWKHNKLRFENASFDEIANTLERWYAVKIDLKNDSGHLRHYTVSFNDEPLDKVLYVLQKLSGMKYQINNKNIEVNLKNCKKE